MKTHTGAKYTFVASLLLLLVGWFMASVLPVEASINIGTPKTVQRGESATLNLTQTDSCTRSVPDGIGAGISAAWKGIYNGNYSPLFTYNNPGTFTFTCMSTLDSTIGGSATITVNDCPFYGLVWNGTNSCVTPTPTTVTATPSSTCGSKQITINWSNVPSAGSYQVYRNGARVADLGAGTLSFIDTVPSDGTNYPYTVGTWSNAGGMSSTQTTASPNPVTSPAVCSYTVSFAGNGADGGGTAAQTITYNNTVALSGNGYTRTGYTFTGWSTTAGGAVAYVDRANYTMGAGNVTLHAQWLIITYPVTYSANSATSGSAPGSQTKIYGTGLTLQTNSGSLARTGFTFVGWNTATNGKGFDYLAGSTYSDNAALTLFAKWIPLPPTPTSPSHTCNANGTSVTLNWTLPAGITQFDAYINNTDLTWSTGLRQTLAGTGNSTTFTVSPGVPYDWWTHSYFAPYPVQSPTNVRGSFRCPYLVTYDANSATSGTPPASQQKVFGTNLTLQTNSGSLARNTPLGNPSYTFVGWNTAANGSGDDYSAGGTYSINAALTLYAKWIAVPIGNLDVVSCDTTAGWTCDVDNYNQPLEVHLYNGASYSVKGTANISREAAVAAECGGVSAHGFAIPTPDRLKDGTNKSINTYGINIGSTGWDKLLGGSPKILNCPAPTAVFDANPATCTIVVNGIGCSPSLSWNSSNVSGGGVTLTNCSGSYYGKHASGAQSDTVYVPYNLGCYRIYNRMYDSYAELQNAINEGYVSGLGLAEKYVTSVCATGAQWTTGSCKDVNMSTTNTGPVGGSSFLNTGTITFAGVATNIGSRDAGQGGWADLEVDWNSDNTWTNYNAFSGNLTGAFVAGASKNLTRAFPNPPVGAHRYRFNIDVTNSLVESDENNNRSAWVSFTVTATAQPNLKPTSVGEIITSSGSMFISEVVRFSSNVENVGTMPTPTGFSNTFAYRWNNAGVFTALSVHSKAVLSAPGVHPADFTGDLNLSQSGTLNVRYCVDYVPETGVVSETDETGNCFTRDFVVASPATTYTVTYHANGATGGIKPDNQSKNHGVSLLLATNIGGLTRNGFTFAGWHTAADGVGTTSYAVGTNYYNNANVTLYAKWDIDTPANFSAITSSSCGGMIDLSWNNVSGLTYSVSNDGGANYVNIGAINSVILTLNPGSSYNLRLRAHFGATVVSTASALDGVLASGACAGIPVLSNPSHSAVADSSALLAATLDSDGGSAITDRGFCIGVATFPTACTISGGTALGAFNQIRSSLIPGNTYYYRGYTANVNGRGYTTDRSFETLASVPGSITVTPGACGTGQLNLDWPDAAGASSYSVYNAANDNFIGNSIGSNYVHSGFLSTPYVYYVRSNNDSGDQSADSVDSTVQSTLGACAAPNPELLVIGCIIPDGTNPAQCVGEVDFWNIPGAVTPELRRTSPNPEVLSDAPTGSDLPVILTRDSIANPDGANVISTFNAGALYLTRAVMASCQPTSFFSGTTNVCRTIPEISITATPNLVRKGERAKVYVDINDVDYAMTCTFNNVAGLADFSHSGANPNPPLYERETSPLTSAFEVQVNCSIDSQPTIITSARTRINVVPTIEEI